MEKLIFVPQLTIPLPKSEEEIKNINYIKNSVEMLIKKVNIKCYWREIIKDPETSFCLMIVDDSEKNQGMKRKAILNPNIRYIGINSISIGKSFACYILLSEYI